MNQILAMAWKDLRSTARNLPALTMMLLAPLALAALLGFAFGGDESFSISATKVVVANEDEGVSTSADATSHVAGDAIVDVLRSADLNDLFDVSEVTTAAEARRRVDGAEDAVAVIIPADFSKAILGSSSTSKTTVEVYEDPTRGIGGDITKSVVEQTLVTFNGARAAAAAAAGLAIRSGRIGEAAELAEAAAAGFIDQGGSAGVTVTQRSPQLPEGKKTEDVSVTGVILAGMMVFFLFFGASNVARTILDEDQAGTLPRLFTTPTPRRTILAGKFASVFTTVAVQAVILLIAGRLIFGIHWGGIDAVVMLTLTAAAVAASLALLIVSLVRTPGQAGAISAGVYLILALVGGNFVGTAAMTGIYATLQRLTPNGWLLLAWDTTMRGGRLTDVGVNLLVALAFGLAFFVAAVLLFRRRFS